jgi:hypothetical protein
LSSAVIKYKKSGQEEGRVYAEEIFDPLRRLQEKASKEPEPKEIHYVFSESQIEKLRAKYPEAINELLKEEG